MTDRVRAVLWPTVFAMPALALLLGLGVWQMQRLDWKEGLLENIAERTVLPPVSPAIVAERLAAGEDVEYVRAAATGIYDHAREMHLYQTRDGQPGWHVYTPLVDDYGTALIVNRGFVPLALKEADARPDGLPGASVTVTGLVRMPVERNLFVPANDVAGNAWYWRDHAAMAALAGADGVRTVLPFVLDAETGGDPGEIPVDGTTIVDLPNNHFGYALTWFGLAGTLVLIYVPFIAGRLRRSAGEEDHGDSL